MKRILAFLLALTMLLTLCACGGFSPQRGERQRRADHAGGECGR